MIACNRPVTWLVASLLATRTVSLQSQTRARFLSSSAAAFVATTGALASDPEQCFAAGKTSEIGKNNPRYIDQEVQMKYGETPGMSKCLLIIACVVVIVC